MRYQLGRHLDVEDGLDPRGPNTRHARNLEVVSQAVDPGFLEFISGWVATKTRYMLAYRVPRQPKVFAYYRDLTFLCQ